MAVNRESNRLPEPKTLRTDYPTIEEYLNQFLRVLRLNFQDIDTRIQDIQLTPPVVVPAPEWGNIIGTLSAQTDLASSLALKAPLDSPTFTGTVVLPAGQVINGVTLTTGGSTSSFLSANGTYESVDIPDVPAVSLHQATGTVLTINTWVTILFDTEAYDTNSWHSTSVNTGRITVDITGRISLIGTVDFGAGGNATYALRLLKNGTVIKSIAYGNPQVTSGISENMRQQIYDEVACVPGDYFELQAQTNSPSPTTGTGIEKTSFKASCISAAITVGGGGGGGGGSSWGSITGTLSSQSDLQSALDAKATTASVALKQDTLVSGTNIKTVNGNSLVGSGDITITGATAVKTASITVPSARGMLSHTETIVDVDVSPTSKITLSLGSFLDSDENDPELLDVQSMSARAGTGSLDVTMSFGTRTRGIIKLNYIIGV